MMMGITTTLKFSRTFFQFIVLFIITAITSSEKREYFIACVEEEWDYAPTGRDLIHNEDITEESKASTWLFGNGINRIGSKYIKALFREYNDDTFKKRKERDNKWLHLGSIGPVIRALEGDIIVITYFNNCSFETSMHPHGLKYLKESEGAPYDNNPILGNIIKPNDIYVYEWMVREHCVDNGQSSKMWLYHSHVQEVKDIHSGLVGPIIITKLHKQKNINSKDFFVPCDIDREFITFFVLYNENESLLFERNLKKYLNIDEHSIIDDMNYDEFIENEDFKESNLMHSINGYLFGNLNQLIMNEKETVRWYIGSFGNEADGPHSPHWHGNILQNTFGGYTDAIMVIPGTSETVTMKTDATGDWLFHCHVFDHITAGMMTIYTVNPLKKE